MPNRFSIFWVFFQTKNSKFSLIQFSGMDMAKCSEGAKTGPGFGWFDFPESLREFWLVRCSSIVRLSLLPSFFDLRRQFSLLSIAKQQVYCFCRSFAGKSSEMRQIFEHGMMYTVSHLIQVFSLSTR